MPIQYPGLRIAGPHADIAHINTAHGNTAHSDDAHVNTPHTDGNGPIPHGNTPHGDSAHVNTPHSNRSHYDAAHSNTVHSNVIHEDCYYEDFTSWTELDPWNRLTQVGTRSTWTGMTRGDPETWLRKDFFSAGGIRTTFTMHFVIEETAQDAGDADSRPVHTFLDMRNQASPDEWTTPVIQLRHYQVGADDSIYVITLNIHNGTDGDSDTSVNLDVGTTYYCTLTREDRGRNVTLYIYNNPAKGAGDLVDTVAASLIPFTTLFRYVFAPWKKDNATDVDDWVSGYIENLVSGDGGVHGNVPHENVPHSNCFIVDLTLVDTADQVAGVGGVPRLRKGSTTLAIYTLDPAHDYSYPARYKGNDGIREGRILIEEGHINTVHTNSPHTNVAHGDTPHSNSAHVNTVHINTAHGDVSHENGVEHTNTAHGNTAHGDTIHGDGAHSDSAHSNIAHIDVAHGDALHFDTAHCDT